ncbi:Athe_2463 domain-containing protein [Paenibacillus sp. MY03]|uniref:Athe_2463 domain-containing protein n=1 Tax=Paenibacillus sp. MY03 TaxID=302980 RepID=UPI00117BF32A|nr:hypothetical protein [Paenibacillus sp. MY03]
MLRSIRRFVFLTMVILCFTSLFNFTGWTIDTTFAADTEPPETINGYTNRCGYNPLATVDGYLPEGVPPCSANGFKFNSKYYYQTAWPEGSLTPLAGQRRLEVYGDVKSVKSIQEFKKGWQKAGPDTIDYTNGHFLGTDPKTGKTVRGEYRYLGYTRDGNAFSNIHFIVDSDSGNILASKHWVYRPWAQLPVDYKYKPGSPGEIYGDVADNVTIQRFDYLVPILDKALGFKITQGVKYADRYRVLNSQEPDNTDPRNYMSIDQEPSARAGGFGNMYHYSWESHSTWYHTYALPKLAPEQKKQTPALCTAQPVSKDPIPIGKSKIVKVEMIVTGTLQDDMYFGGRATEAEYYTRKDIDYWRLDMKDPNASTYIQKASNNYSDGVVLKSNQSSATFTIEVDTSKLDKTSDDVWLYKSHAGAFIVYTNHTYNTPSTAGQYCNFQIEFEPTEKQPMLSDFGVIPEIQFDRKSQFTSLMVGYEDFSYGSDADYYEFEIINKDDGTTVSRKYDPAIPEVKAPKAGHLDQKAVEQWLYNFMASKFAADMVTEPVKKTFEIKQKIVDKDAAVNQSSERIRTVVITQVPYVYSCEQEAWPAPPQFITPEADWPLDWYDVVPFPVTDGEPDIIPHRGCEDPAGYDEFTKRVFIDGSEINATAFYRGDYIFGENKLGIREVKTTFTAPDGSESFKIQHVVVHKSKPNVAIKLEGLYKQNRTMIAFDQSKASNDQWVEQNAPLEITSFSFVKPNDLNLKCRVGFCESNTSEKQYMYKETGSYQISIAAKRVIPYGNGKSITRYSDPYVVDYEILPDHEPAVIAHAYESQISRLDQLKLFYDAVSTDGDFISEKRLEVHYDSNNDGTMDEIVFQSNGDLSELPVFEKLGQYKIVAYAKESTNQDRLMEFITPGDNKTKTIESYFFVDNYSPSSDLYLDIPTQKPDMDIYFMLDSNLKQSSTDYIRGNGVTLTNAFTQANMLANLSIWDMKTYTDTISASTSNGTGTSYPSSTYYYSSNGYSGTLSLYSTSNSPYTRDEGKFVKVTDSKTGTGTCSSSVTTYYDSKGNYKDSSSWNNCGSSQYYSDGKYSGTIGRSGESPNGPSCGPTGTPNGSCSRGWTAYYSGTVYWTHDVWEPREVSYDSYTGFYSGSISKAIRQWYDNSFMRSVPAKYVIYISDNQASQLSDLQNVINKNEAKLIIVGSNVFRSQISHDHFISNTGAIEDVVASVISYIAESNPAVPKVLKLVGDEIETRTATFDYESDSIPTVSDQLQIIQDPQYYDNSMGFESINGKQLIAVKNNNNWFPYQSKVTLSRPGKYQFIRRVKDRPTTDPNFSEYGYFSNESVVEVIVHRKPIPDVILDFDYVSASNMYKTTWIDASYDLDHNITRAATDRGIQARSIKLTKQGSGEVWTRIPSELSSGTYILDYRVQDIEGVWSDPIVRTYVLPETVPVQLKSNLRTQDENFSLNNVPASEKLVAHELWTRFPYSVALSLSMGGYINKSVPYYTGSRSGNDIAWNDETLVIPNTTPDGLYSFKIRANGSVAGSYAENTYNVRVSTPINLNGSIDSINGLSRNLLTLTVGESYRLAASTTKYPDSAVNGNATTVTAFKGTPYQRTITLTSTTNSTTGIGSKSWSNQLTIAAIPDGSYTFEWTARTPNGNVQTVAKTVVVMNNRPPTPGFSWWPNPVYEGDTVTFRSLASDPDRDPITVAYELTSPTGVRQNYSYNLTYPYSTAAPVRRMTETGAWKMRQTVTDGRSALVMLNQTIQVLPLTLSGNIGHTDAWNERRQAYNLKESGNPESPRGYNVFWAGERLMLQAATTATPTATKAIRVEATFGNRKTTLSAVGSTSSIWKGEMWDDAMEELPDGPATIIFVAYYSNGTTKTTNVSVIFEGNISDTVGVHRVK